MSQKGKSILQRIKAKLSGRSRNNKRYSRDVPQSNGDSNDPLDSHFANLNRGNAGTRPITAGTEKHHNTSPLVDRTDARQNDLRIVNDDLGRDETDSRLTNAQTGLNATDKGRRASTTLSERNGNVGNRRRSDTAESISIPRKPVKGSHGNIARTNGTVIPHEPKTNGLAVRDEHRPDSMALPIRGSRGSVESGDMPMPEEAEGTQKLISSPDVRKADFSDFDLTDTVDTDHYTYHAPAVTHEVVRPHIHEIIHKEIHRDIHNHEYRHYIQPIFEQEFLPARHFVPDDEGNLREVSVEDLEGIPGCTGATSDYQFETKQVLDKQNYGGRDRLIGQTV